jgi:hypothetical protein
MGAGYGKYRLRSQIDREISFAGRLRSQMILGVLGQFMFLCYPINKESG